MKLLLLIPFLLASCSFPPEPEIKFGIVLSRDDIPDVIEDTAPLKSMIVKPWDGLKYDVIINLPDAIND